MDRKNWGPIKNIRADIPEKARSLAAARGQTVAELLADLIDRADQRPTVEERLKGIEKRLLQLEASAVRPQTGRTQVGAPTVVRRQSTDQSDRRQTPRTKWPREKKIEAIKMHLTGKYQSEISAETGVPMGTVGKWVNPDTEKNDPEAWQEARQKLDQ